MIAGDRRDAAALTAGIERWLRATRAESDRSAVTIDRPTTGLSNETIIVTIARPAPPDHRTSPERLVIRLPPLEASFPDLDLGHQAALHTLLAANGVPAPTPTTHEPDPTWLGEAFVVMPFVPGHIPGQAPPFDPWISRATPALQRSMEDAFIEVLAALHRVPWRDAGAHHLVRGAGASLRDEVRWWQRYADWACDGEPEPRLVELLAWCHQAAPASSSAAALVWGDARLGNVIFDDRARVVAALDWETAAIGTPELDVGWYLAMDAALAYLVTGARVPGFRDAEGFSARYESATGVVLVDLAWHEVFALARSICITHRQARVATRAGTTSILPGDDTHPMFPLAERWAAAWEPGDRQPRITA